MIIDVADRLNHISEYYFSKKRREVEKMKSKGKDVISLAIGSPDLAPSENTIDKLNNATKEESNHGYGPYIGLASLKEAITKWYFDIYKVNLVSDTEILPLLGSKEGIMHISMAFLNPDDEVLIPEIGYPAYQSVSQLVGAKIRTYQMQEDTWHPNFNELEGQDFSKTKIMWVNYPNMPTGTPASKTLFEKLIAFGLKNKILICHDNPYSLTLNKKKPISILSVKDAKETAIELNSMSKSHNMAGWRVGWVCGKEDHLKAILKISSNINSGMFIPIQHAAIAALENKPEWYKKQNKIYADRKEIAHKILDALKCSYDKGQEGLFVWGKIPDNVKSSEVMVDNLLYEKHIFITPGFIFGKKGNRYIRISLCAPEEKLEEAYNRIIE